MEPSFARTVLTSAATAAGTTFLLGWLAVLGGGTTFFSPVAGWVLCAAMVVLLVSPAFEAARPYLAGAGLGVVAGVVLYGLSFLVLIGALAGG